MKILHLADLHYRASKFKDIDIAHNDSLRIAEEENVDLIVIAGDIWDGSTANTAGAMFSTFIRMINQYADIAPVAMIYGTPTHDVAGSLEIFESQHNRFGITLLQPGQPYFYNNTIPIIKTDVSEINSSLLLLGVPEPSKKHIVSNIESKGKTATEAAVRHEMHNFFLGLTAIRKEFENIPCILLYHGQVAGSKLQNDQKIDRGSGISITYDDLAVVGADYCALGDIHEPQQIGDLPAYYPGSFYNTGFGETHQPGCNLIEIINNQRDLFVEEAKKVIIERHLFNLPMQVKLKVEFQNLDSISWNDFSGKRVWIEIRCTKEQALNLDTKDILKQLLNSDADIDSRVTLDIIAIETVRAAEITDQKNLRDKVLIWAEASGKDIPERILEKADELEGSETSKNATSDAVSIQINKLILRGAIGIHKGLKVNEITVDFDNIAPGIVALIGGNGQGKTTLIENLHPWPQMLTRAKKLQDHFRLKDSCRDLYFSDLKTGIKYRALLEVDGKNKSGSIDYYLFQDLGNGYEAIESISGRKESYIDAIEKLFGSLTLYQKTAFITQKNTKSNPDLSSATKGEKKIIFRELSGLDYMEEYSQIAKQKAAEIESDTLRDSGKIDALSGVNDEITEKKNRKAEISIKIGEISTKKEEFETNTSQLNTRVISLRSEVEKNNGIMSQINTLSKTEDEYYHMIEDNQGLLKSAQIALKFKNEAIILKEKVESFRVQKQEIITKKNEHDFQANSISSKWLEACRKVDDQKQNINKVIENLNNDKRGITKRLDKLSIEIETLHRETEFKPDTTCPTCGQDLPEATRQEIIQKWEMKTGELDVFNRTFKEIELEELLPVVEEIDKKSTELNEIQNLSEPELFPFDETELKKINASLSFIETRYDDACSTIKKAEEAETQIRISTDKINDATQSKALIRTQILDLTASYNSKLDSELSTNQNLLKEAQDTLSEITEQFISNKTTLEEIEKQIESLKIKEIELEELKTGIQTKLLEVADWRSLQEVCGANGIQALELDALAPNIASIANYILKSAYGSKFQIEFRTTKSSGSGSKTKEIEDFSIWIMDVENGTEQELEDLSGGEAVWIRKAIYDAFSIIRANNTGKSFLTACQDEADGALDLEMKEKYFLMLEAAHNESHRRHTIIITHSREIQEMSQQKIVMTELKETSAVSTAA
jgi:DNA repair protein SbcC/Rad50